ncbi:MAG: transporter permease [Rhodospirillales bacterium]|jgi:spermidine/putrescine transport system permease protein|nr:transporter permease [Rhodospirillales bacterium]
MAELAMARRKAFDLRHQRGFPTIAALCFVFLYAPIALLLIYSFNASSSLTAFQGFSVDWYAKALNNREVQRAAWISIEIATVATIASTLLATAAALATARALPFRGMLTSYVIINFPLMVPEIITAIATLSFFALLGIERGFWTIALAHICFCVPFAYMPIRARLEDMDRNLELAAADLYATPWATFRRITLPLLLPGILAGAMLAFIVSIDDYIITAFVGGPGNTTLPVYIFSTVRNVVTPEINAVSSLLMLVSIGFVSLSLLTGIRRSG